MYTDPIADLLTRIRNAQTARHRSVLVPKSSVIHAVLEVLKKEGFVESYTDKPGNPDAIHGKSHLKFGSIEVVLNYFESGDPIINSIERVSTPGQRVYSGVEELPKVFSGLGISILSTSEGVISDREARKRGIGGEVIARIG